MREVHMPVLQVRCVGDVCIGWSVQRIRRISETSEERLHKPFEVEQCHVSPKRGAKLLVPVENRLGRRKRVGSSTEKLTIEDAVPIRISDHEVRDLQALAFELLAHGFRRVVPVPISVVGMNVTLSAIPRASGRIVPMIQFQCHVQVLPRCQLNLPLQWAIFQSTEGTQGVLPRWYRRLCVARGIEMEQATLNAIERARRRQIIASFLLYRQACREWPPCLLLYH